MFLVGSFYQNESNYYSGKFFSRQFSAIGPLFCSFVQHHQLELRTSKTYSKRQNLVQNKNIDVQNLENIGPPPPFGVFHSDFFRHYATFMNFFVFHKRVSPSFVSIFCTTMDVKKSQRVPLYIFRHCDTVQKSNC